MDPLPYILSLGSNLGNRRQFLQQALGKISSLAVIIARSPVYQTRPVEMNPGTPPFLNMVAQVLSGLDPPEFLHCLQVLERALGREPGPGRDRSRTIDIDILFADGMVVNQERLVIPHPRLDQRAFVLVPLNDMAPDFVHPVRKKTVRQLLKELAAADPQVMKGVFRYRGA